MSKSKLLVPAWLMIVLALFTAYSNCSEVRFAVSDEAIRQQTLEFQSTSSIRINGGDQFTNQKLVQLDLNSPRALEMKISDKSDCSDGTWEPYSSAKQWSLSKTNDTAAVYVQYKDLRGQLSACTSDDIIHDDIAPTAAFGLAPNLIIKSPSLSVSWVSFDNLSGIDSSSCVDAIGLTTACTNSIDISHMAEGTNQVSIKIKDKAGNESPAYTYSWLLDQTLPVVVINTKPAALTGSGDATLGFSANDTGSGVDRLMCQLDQQGYQVCVSPKQYTGLNQGAHSFDVYAIDKAGNRSTTASAAWTVDMTAPSIRFTQTPPVAANSAQAVFGFDGSKNGSPITRFECRLDSAAFAACTSPLTLTGLSQGTHAFEFRGIDSLGNVSSPLRYQWVVDLAAPILTITTGPGALVNASSANFQWTVTDALSGVKLVECRIDSAAYQACNSLALNTTGITEGAHKFDVRATDIAGNVASASRSWTVDLTAPTVTITSAPGAYTNVLNAQFSFVGSDTSGIAGYECRVDNGAYAACTSPNTVNNVLEGGHVFYVRTTDKAGNVSAPASAGWNLDLSPPIIRIIASPVNLKDGDHAVIQYEVIDPGSGVASVRCGLATPTAAINDCAVKATVDAGAVSLGNYTFTITAVDKVGNSLKETVAFTVSARPIICDPFVIGRDAICNGGLIGDIFYLDSANRSVFQGMANKTVDFYYSNGIKVDAVLNLNQLFVSTRSFTAGFPLNSGSLVKDNAGNALNEYFAFRLNTVLKLDAVNDQPGWYQFATLSDDGSMVLIKPAGATAYQTLVANDGDHSTRMGCSTQAIYIDDTTRLDTLIKYYQGPKTEIAMTLMWKKVKSMTEPLDSACGLTGNDAFFGASYQDFTGSGYGALVGRGWRVVAPSNYIAPPR